MVLIPHPTEELKLRKFQKKLIADLNTCSTIHVASTPLWIEIPSETSLVTKDDLKNFSKTIISVEPAELTQTDSEIYLAIKIKTSKSEIQSNLSLLKLYKGNSKSLTKNTELPFKKIKIFRLGIPEDLSSNSKAIKDFVWCKL